MRALVIGGTGPTGHHIVNGLRHRGWEVGILHTGRHEVDEIPADVEHIHTNPFDESELTHALGKRTFDLTVATYGRLRRVAEIMVGRTGRFLSVGGGPAYRGYMNPGVLDPPGLPVPVAEDAALLTDEAEDGKGFRVRRSEQVVFDHHPTATHFRYPYIYGPYQIAPREWCIVRRIIDRRPFIVLPEDGLSLNQFGAAANVAHALLLAVDQPETASGQIYNCGDETVLTLKQVVEVVSAALDYRWEVVSLPWALAKPARPMIGQAFTTHRVFDLTKLKAQLGYRDVIAPVDALTQFARWLVEHPMERGGRAERGLQDPFDYVAEDRLVTAWRDLLRKMPDIEYAREPWYTASYSGPGGSERRAEW